MSDLYEDDIAAWADQQAALLRARSANQLDWDNLAEEIEDVKRQLLEEIESRLAIACQHLLKWQFQPEMRSGSWRASVVEARQRIARRLQKTPTLRAYPATVLAESYEDGRLVAEAETGVSDLPAACPWTIEQVLDRDFWPGP